MKRKALITILLIAALAAASAQIQFSEIMPKDARSMGMGGAFPYSVRGTRASSEIRPDSRGRPTRHDRDISAWAYVAPTSENLGRVQQIINGSATDTQIINWAGDWIVSNNGPGRRRLHRRRLGRQEGHCRRRHPG